MKIKTVCELTGLTARTVRVYIDEKLIAPDFTENYLGRRNFEFSDDDVEALKNIAILRKNDFSIDEIRDIICDIEKSTEIIKNVKNRIAKKSEEYNRCLQAFSYIDFSKTYTISELALALSEIPNEMPLLNERYKISVLKICKAAFEIFKSALVFMAVWLPIVLCFFSYSGRLAFYSFPKFNPKFILLSIITLFPSILFLFISKKEFNYKKIIKRILLILCVISIPFSAIMPIGIVSHSETTDFRNYRDFDPDCLATRNKVFNEVFPTWPHYFENVKNEDGEWEAVYFDAKYYYRFFYGMDYTYDIYAEWPLEADKFGEEVQRVKGVFEKAIADKTYGYKFVEIEKGEYTCLILYSGDEPFQKATNNYQYLIFAYSETTNSVRYIY